VTDRAKSGHNGGPPLDEPADRQRGMCKHCVHWKAPPESEQRAFEHFRLGLSRRRVKRPTGSRDRVLIGNRTTAVFSATTAEFGCRNFESGAAEAARPRRRLRDDLGKRPDRLARA
jgi:hypothetical protein